MSNVELYQYRCRINRVIDGDTLDVDIDLGFDMHLRNARIRLVGVDCPEIRTRDLVEKHYGELATEFVKDRFPEGQRAVLLSREWRRNDPFGRILGDFVAGDSTLTALLLENHHAVPWDSNNREGMEQQHVQNRQLLTEAGYPAPEAE